LNTTKDSENKDLLTVEEAFTRTGGFGCFQKIVILFCTLGNGGGAFLLYAFSFLEKEPIFKC
jgi:hypothetical protein